MPSTRRSYHRVLLLAATAVVTLACSGNEPRSLTAPDVPLAAGSASGVRALSVDYCTIEATPVNFPTDGHGNFSHLAGGQLEVIFSNLPDDGVISLALWDASALPGQRQLLASDEDTLVSSDRAIRLRVTVPPGGDDTCIQFHLNAACDDVPGGGAYNSSKLIRTWLGGTKGCTPRGTPEPTPTPAPTPTPEPPCEFSDYLTIGEGCQNPTLTR